MNKKILMSNMLNVRKDGFFPRSEALASETQLLAKLCFDSAKLLRETIINEIRSGGQILGRSDIIAERAMGGPPDNLKQEL